MIGCPDASEPPNVFATSRSFQTQRNWKMPNEAIAGIDSGSTIVRKIRRWLAPSTRAASISDSGSCAMKLCSRNTASGSENIVCDSQISASVPLEAEARDDRDDADVRAAVEELLQRHERHLQRHDLQREDREEDEVAAPERAPTRARRPPSRPGRSG